MSSFGSGLRVRGRLSALALGAALVAGTQLPARAADRVVLCEKFGATW